MAQNLEHKYATPGSVQRRRVREELEQLTDDDVSVSSPITGGAEEVAIVTPGPDSDYLVVRVENHDGDWTKTSEKALEAAVLRAPGVESVEERKGGYIAEKRASDEEDED